MAELNIYGVYVPVLVIQAVLAYIVLRLLMRVTDPWVDKGWIFLPKDTPLALTLLASKNRFEFVDLKKMVEILRHSALQIEQKCHLLHNIEA